MSYILPAYMHQHLPLKVFVSWYRNLTNLIQTHNHHEPTCRKCHHFYNSHGIVRQDSYQHLY
ncbi:hypothetical protein AWP98_00085 [Escherichia coli]|nr:hypothetical protein AWP96_00275 [Escherichia coli]OKX74541.1 hypothetical protein AWP98_00085 [Escherichia coli]